MRQKRGIAPTTHRGPGARGALSKLLRRINPFESGKRTKAVPDHRAPTNAKEHHKKSSFLQSGKIIFTTSNFGVTFHAHHSHTHTHTGLDRATVKAGKPEKVKTTFPPVSGDNIQAKTGKNKQLSTAIQVQNKRIQCVRIQISTRASFHASMDKWCKVSYCFAQNTAPS